MRTRGAFEPLLVEDSRRSGRRKALGLNSPIVQATMLINVIASLKRLSPFHQRISHKYVLGFTQVRKRGAQRRKGNIQILGVMNACLNAGARPTALVDIMLREGVRARV